MYCGCRYNNNTYLHGIGPLTLYCHIHHLQVHVCVTSLHKSCFTFIPIMGSLFASFDLMFWRGLAFSWKCICTCYIGSYMFSTYKEFTHTLLAEMALFVIILWYCFTTPDFCSNLYTCDEHMHVYTGESI